VNAPAQDRLELQWQGRLQLGVPLRPIDGGAQLHDQWMATDLRRQRVPFKLRLIQFLTGGLESTQKS
jgi:hypothetical protein